MQVEITRFARLQLMEIYNYYKLKASERIALQITHKILDSVEELGSLRGIGSIEPNLAHLQVIINILFAAITKLFSGPLRM
jgi:plasmid stabilization system protein ParE